MAQGRKGMKLVPRRTPDMVASRYGDLIRPPFRSITYSILTLASPWSGDFGRKTPQSCRDRKPGTRREKSQPGVKPREEPHRPLRGENVLTFFTSLRSFATNEARLSPSGICQAACVGVVGGDGIEPPTLSV